MTPPPGTARARAGSAGRRPRAARVTAQEQRCGRLVRSMPTSVATERELGLALVHLRAAQSRALRVLRDAERSLVDYEARFARRKARLRALGFVGISTSAGWSSALGVG
jgi:hypothetical protein